MATHMDKAQVLAQAVAVLNQPNQPWEITVNGDSIVAYWRWMDATFFAPAAVNDEVRQYTFTVTLQDNGKWREHDQSSSTSTQVGPTGASMSFNAFSGHQSSKSFHIGVGKDKQTGQSGVVVNSFSTDLIKKPIRAWLEQCGWKKAGLFG